MSKHAYQTIILSVVASLTSLLTVNIMDQHLYAATDSTTVSPTSVTNLSYRSNIHLNTNNAVQFPGYPNYAAAPTWSWSLPQCTFWSDDHTDMQKACVNTYDGKKYKYHVRKMQALCPAGYIATGIRVDDMVNQLNGVWPQCQQLQICIGTACTNATSN